MKAKLLSLVLVLTFLLAACSPARPATSSTEPPAKFPTGKFVAEDGKSFWAFNPDGSWSYRSPAGLPLEGTYTTSGNTYTETWNNAMVADAANCNTLATYTWSLSGSRLTFSTSSDKCEARKAWYTGSAFVKADEQPAASSAPAVQPFPFGRYSARTEAVQYNPDGTFEFYTDASKIEPVLVGKYTVKGDTITIIADDTDPNCQGTFTYKWALAGNVLTYSSEKEDPCRGRREANADSYTYDAAFVPEIDITAMDYSYISPMKVPSGWVRVVLANKGSEPHHVQFLRLNDGVTFDQFKEALSKGEGPALAMTRQVGGVGAVAPGMSAQAVINLAAGNYVILCFIPSASDHVAHEEKGMISQMTVLDRSGHGVEPTVGLTVHLKDFEFGMPDTVPAGPLTVQVVNDGPEPHEFNILQLADGKTVNDVVQFLGGAGGPPPFAPIGGMNGLDVGATGYAELNLKPGNYVAICNIPSPKAEGHPHFALGMIKQFTVAP